MTPNNSLQQCYVIDTDVLLHNPYIFTEINKGLLVIAFDTIAQLEQELEKDGSNERNARIVLNVLKDLQAENPLTQGVILSPYISVRIMRQPEGSRIHPVIGVSQMLKESGVDVTLLSNACSTRVEAQELGITVAAYYGVRSKKDYLYKGWRVIGVPAVQLKQQIPEDLEHLIKEDVLTLNEYVVVESQHNTYNYRLFRYIGGRDKFREVGQLPFTGPIAPKNVQQAMALDALFDPDISLITLIGAAGTGKTLLSLFAGLQQTLHDDEYQRIFVARPVVPLGKDIGYLPGDLQEKMHLWMQPVYDSIAFIIRSSYAQHHLQHIKEEGGHNEKKPKFKHAKDQKSEKKLFVGSVEELIEEGKLTLEAITYMRGRSLAYQFIIIDEVQNLSLHEVKTIVSRVGHNSKIVLCGDPDQIDSHFLDFFTNGLTIVNQKFKGESLYATVYLEHSERSELSRLAAELL